MDWDDVVTGGQRAIEYLRATAHGFVMLTGIVLSIGLFYVVTRLTWLLIEYLERTILQAW